MKLPKKPGPPIGPRHHRSTWQNELCKHVRTKVITKLRIAIFGASGKVGRLVVDEALARGHEVVAFVHSHPLPEHKNLSTVKGDIYNASEVAAAIKGSDAVICALGSWGTPKKDVVSSGVKNMIPAMQGAGIKRIISLTGHGASAPSDKFELTHEFSRLILLILVAKILKDGELHIKLLNQSDLEWTALRSPVMNNRGNPGEYKLRRKRPWPLATINRQAVAQCMVDLIETREFIRQAPFLVRK